MYLSIRSSASLHECTALLHTLLPDLPPVETASTRDFTDFALLQTRTGHLRSIEAEKLNHTSLYFYPFHKVERRAVLHHPTRPDRGHRSARGAAARRAGRGTVSLLIHSYHLLYHPPFHAQTTGALVPVVCACQTRPTALGSRLKRLTRTKTPECPAGA